MVYSKKVIGICRILDIILICRTLDIILILDITGLNCNMVCQSEELSA